jgi:hypothetical protein
MKPLVRGPKARRKEDTELAVPCVKPLMGQRGNRRGGGTEFLDGRRLQSSSLGGGGSK